MCLVDNADMEIGSGRVGTPLNHVTCFNTDLKIFMGDPASFLHYFDIMGLYALLRSIELGSELLDYRMVNIILLVYDL